MCTEMTLFLREVWPDERKVLAISCLREEALDRLVCLLALFQKHNIHIYDEQVMHLRKQFNVMDMEKLFGTLLTDDSLRALPIYNTIVSYESEVSRMIQDLNKKFS